VTGSTITNHDGIRPLQDDDPISGPPSRILSVLNQLCSLHPIRTAQNNSSYHGTNDSSPPTSASATGIPTNRTSHFQQQRNHHLVLSLREYFGGYSTRNRLLQQQVYQQQELLPAQSHDQVRVKRESMSYKKEDKGTVGTGAATVALTSVRTLASQDDLMPSTSDFVKKLYK